jgi:hypothetical protein
MTLSWWRGESKDEELRSTPVKPEHLVVDGSRVRYTFYQR